MSGSTPGVTMSRSTEPEAVKARRLVIHALRTSGLSYPQVGRVLGRDHTTVLYHHRRVCGDAGDRALALELERRHGVVDRRPALAA